MTDEQVRRLAAQRAELIATGWLTLTELAARRREPDVATVGGWVAARRLERALIALDPRDGTIRVPTFQLTDGGDPRAELHPLLEVLFGAGIGSWAAWAWLTSPSSFLSDDVPERVAATDPTRALQAATRFVRAAHA
ncbi:hypothetical protein [Modestobacter lacusdianchii]